MITPTQINVTYKYADGSKSKSKCFTKDEIIQVASNLLAIADSMPVEAVREWRHKGTVYRTNEWVECAYAYGDNVTWVRRKLASADDHVIYCYGIGEHENNTYRYNHIRKCIQ